MYRKLIIFSLSVLLISCGGSGSAPDLVFDIDGDGVVDSLDAFPQNAAEFKDSDNDGIGDNGDPDDDNDGVLDTSDAFPLDSSETLDTDGDGIGNNADPDLDNDGILDDVDTDSDNDGTDDIADAFPLDATETTDTDNDGIGNNADLDDDGDGVADVDDDLPLIPNALPTLSVTAPAVLNEKSNYLITAIGGDADGSVTYSWVQVSGVTLDIQQQDSATVSITTPEVTQNELVVFSVTVTDSDGLMITETISVTIVAVVPPSISSFSPDSVTIASGSSIDLTAMFSGGAGMIDQGVGAVASGVALSVSPLETTTYTLTVTNIVGEASTATVTANVILSVSSFSAASPTISSGESVDLTAVFSGGTGMIDSGVGAVESGVALSVSPLETTTYILTLKNIVGEVSTASVTITVVPPPSVISFTTTIATITFGDSVDLTAVFADGSGSIDNGIGAVLTGVAQTVTPATTTTYTLTVTNTVGTLVTRTVTVTVLFALDSLSLSTGTLDQVFQGNQLSYTATVGFLAQSIQISATTLVPGATIKVNNVSIDADNWSQSIALSEGVNTAIDIMVSKNALTRNFSLVITRELAATFAEQAYIKASNTGAGDSFGYSVAIDGDTLAVGAMVEDSSTTGINSTPDELGAGSGAVYVFVRSGTIWTQQAYIKASNTGAIDSFGYSVAIDGDTLAVGAIREDSSTTGINSTPDKLATDSGAVYVFVRSGTIWTQQAYIKASNTGAGDEFGGNVAIDGDTLAVGADKEDSSTTGINSTPDELATDSGAVYVFTRSGTTWVQQIYIKASNTGVFDRFGGNVAIDGETLAVGAYQEGSSTTGINSTPDELANHSGAVYVFTRSGATWTQQAYIKASNTGAGDLFGYSVAIDGDTLAVGAEWENSSTTGINSTPDELATNSGAVYVFTRTGATWTQQAYIKASNTGAGDYFGFSVTIDGDTLAVGAMTEDSSTTGINSTPNELASVSGAVYVFTRSGTTWTQQAYIKASNTGAIDAFGYSVAIDGDTLAVGAMREDSSTTGINSAPDDLSEVSGAVYVFK